MASSLNAILNAGIVPLTSPALRDQMVVGAQTVVNDLIRSGNNIVQMGSNFLINIFSNIMGRLQKAIARVGLAVTRGSTLVQNAFTFVQTLFQSALNIFGPRLDECSLKLRNLLLTNGANTIGNYSDAVKSATNTLQATIQAQLQDFAATVNISSTQGTVYAADITAGLLENITLAYNSTANRTPAYESCLTDQSVLAGYVQQMINENLALCVDAATTSANATKDSLTPEIAALSALPTNATAKLCQCVEGVSLLNLVQRATASTCVTNELKTLNTTSVKTTADAIALKHKQALIAVDQQFDQCMTDITDQVPALLDYVNGEIANCKSYL